MSSAGAVIAILASAVVVCGGLVALVRAVFRLVLVLRDSINATRALTANLGGFSPGPLESRVASVEAQLSGFTTRLAAVELHAAGQAGQ